MTDAFTPPPAGMLSEQIDLPDLRLTLGLVHRRGAGVRVCTWDGSSLRHMSPAAARRLARGLEDSGFYASLGPAIDAVRSLADRVDEINAMIKTHSAMAAFVDMPVEGCA